MSSGQDDLGSGFTIPKRIPKKRRDSDQPSSSLLSSQSSDRPNRKVLPTRASRSADVELTPEWEGMSKLLSHFYARADAGERMLQSYGIRVNDLPSHHYILLQCVAHIIFIFCHDSLRSAIPRGC